MSKAKIKEYFVSVQGEGPYVGYRQLFIRFCGCNLNCRYCDTDFSADNGCFEYTPEELFNRLNENKMLDNIHSVSLTGGEPLIYADFLKGFLPLLSGKVLIYLETNATLPDKLKEIFDYVDIISADIKLPSSSGQNLFDVHEKFFEICKNKEVFIKAVFDNSITDEELKRVCEIAGKFGFELVFSPVMKNDKPVVDGEFMEKTLKKACSIYNKTRLIPQVHKFLNLE